MLAQVVQVVQVTSGREGVGSSLEKVSNRTLEKCAIELLKSAQCHGNIPFRR